MTMTSPRAPLLTADGDDDGGMWLLMKIMMMLMTITVMLMMMMMVMMACSGFWLVTDSICWLAHKFVAHGLPQINDLVECQKLN